MRIHLMYHDVFEQNPNESGFLQKRDLPYKINAVVFENHVKAISDYCIERDLPKESVVFTFDDGGKSFYHVIAPILEKYGYVGVFFISTNYIGTDTFLTEDEIQKLHKSGHIIGSHAHHHVHMNALNDTQIQYEWSTSVKILENIIGEPITFASIPNGDMTKSVITAASNCGIEYLYTSEPLEKMTLFNRMKIVGRYVLLSESTIDEVISIVSSPIYRKLLYYKRLVLRIAKLLLGKYYIKFKNVLYK